MTVGAYQEGPLLLLHEGERPEDAGEAWVSVDVETVDPRLLEVRQ